MLRTFQHLTRLAIFGRYGFYQWVKRPLWFLFSKEKDYVPDLIYHPDGYEQYIRHDGEEIRENWWFDNKIHRISGPARIVRCRRTGRLLEETWYRNGYIHREDGYADISYAVTYSVGRYLLHGAELDREQYNLVVQMPEVERLCWIIQHARREQGLQGYLFRQLVEINPQVAENLRIAIKLV